MVLRPAIGRGDEQLNTSSRLSGWIRPEPMPKVTFGVIVLNGEPFTRYCLRALYPFAHEIIVVEGGHEDTRAVATQDGHSIDGTLEALTRFCAEEDPEQKVTVVTKDGFWPKKDELGRCRTPQSRAYAERATGDYLWQVDIDEFYLADDIRRVLEMLACDPEITAVSFRQRAFWGSPEIEVDGWPLRRGMDTYHRLFRWAPEYRYVTHEPPTVADEMGRDLRTLKWVQPSELAGRGIYLYHYSLLFPWEVEQKTRLYKDENPVAYGGILDWAESSYFKLGHPYRVHNLHNSPSWLKRYRGQHPAEVLTMMDDIDAGRLRVETRPMDDVERLLNSWWYPVGRSLLEAALPISDFGGRARGSVGAFVRRALRPLREGRRNAE
jgi:glycosyltransferase involved in cell wall biosynthesis